MDALKTNILNRLCINQLSVLIALTLTIFAVSAAPDREMVYQLKGSILKVHVVTKGGGHGVGTGVAVGTDMVATNCHVLANAQGVNVSKFGASFTPVAVRADWKHDVCILEFKYMELKPAILGNGDDLQYEQEIFSIGFPGGPPKPLTTYGKIKGLFPLDDGKIVRTSASFVMGASGSPVFDARGQLIAISTFKSPGRAAYFYNVPVKWVKALIALPESKSTESLLQAEQPFWDQPVTERPFFMQVVLPYQNEQWDKLKVIAQKWLDKEPSSAEAHYYYGIAIANLGNLSGAKEMFLKAVNIEGRHADSLITLGMIANQAGDVAEVERIKSVLNNIDPLLKEDFEVSINPKQNGH